MQQLLGVLCTLGAAWYILCFVAVALLSMNYPYFLEWMEGHVMDIVMRVREGLPIYVPPSIDYIPFIYPPLYYYVSALFSLLFGPDFFAARLVSFLSIMGVGALLFAWVRKEGGDKKTALIGTGLFFATYEFSSRWFDVARIDSLYLLLTMAALFCLVHGKGTASACWAGGLCTLAFYTKQNAALVVAPLLLLLLWEQRGRALHTIAIFAVTSFAVYWMYNTANEGWFKYYLFELPASHRVDRNFILGFWRDDLLKPLWPLLLLAAIGIIDIWRSDRVRALRYLALAAGMVGAAYSGRLHRYGWSNVLMPAHLMLALAAALTLMHWKYKWIAQLLVIVQFGLLYYPPARNIPGDEARAQGDAFIDRIAQIEGEVLMPEIQFIQRHAGKESFAYGVAAVDVLQSRDPGHYQFRRELRKEMADAIAQQRYGAIITSRLIRLPGLDQYYVMKEYIDFPQKFVSGYVSGRPYRIYVPRDNVPR
ncbi:MAG: glycosyltransferase family 39 protein [Alphaproteobacteria bacterium]|nr:glycosyltransferase family 39 protein [Alphaproteobacteria bacterium]